MRNLIHFTPVLQASFERGAAVESRAGVAAPEARDAPRAVVRLRTRRVGSVLADLMAHRRSPHPMFSFRPFQRHCLPRLNQFSNPAQGIAIRSAYWQPAPALR